jgi:hypothetical protein
MVNAGRRLSAGYAPRATAYTGRRHDRRHDHGTTARQPATRLRTVARISSTWRSGLRRQVARWRASSASGARLHLGLRQRGHGLPGIRWTYRGARSRRGSSPMAEAPAPGEVPRVRDAAGAAVPLRTGAAKDRILLLLP